MTTVSVLTVVAVAMAGWSSGANADTGGRTPSWPAAGAATPPDSTALADSAAGSGSPARSDPAAGRRLDAMGGSGSAGIDPARARAITETRQDELTGDITFTVPSGTFQGQVTVGLGTTVANARIRYTTDGTEPTAASAAYEGTPLTFTATTRLRARAFVDGAASGAPGTALYLARGIDAQHDLPLVVMDAYGGGKPAREYRDVAVMLMGPRDGTTALSQAPTLATPAGFHLRGQSSANFAKAPYRLELRDGQGGDADYPVLGMPADEDWVLRGPFPDKTLIRDAFAYGIGRDMGLRAPRYAFVEVYLNLDAQPMAADDYQGVYLLLETIKNTPDRLNLSKLTSTDVAMPAVSGGYVMQFNALASEPPTLPCTAGTPGGTCWSDLELIEPDNPRPEQLAWITEYVQKFHDSLRSENPADPDTGYPAYIDVDSFVNRIIHNELGREPDAYIRSTHFVKDRGGKLVAGPLWDYDLAYACYTGFGGGMSSVTGWQFQPGFDFGTTDWFLTLMRDPAFSARVGARWQELRQGVMSDADLNARVTALATPLANAARRNFERWPNLNTATVGGFQTQRTRTWEEQIQILRDFLVQRAAWLDGSGWQPARTAGPASAPPGSPAPGAGSINHPALSW